MCMVCIVCMVYNESDGISGKGKATRFTKVAQVKHLMGGKDAADVAAWAHKAAMQTMPFFFGNLSPKKQWQMSSQCPDFHR